jgi:PEP-CTERM motif
MKYGNRPRNFYLFKLLLMGAAIVGLSATSALASITFTGSSSSYPDLNASAEFDTSGTDLIVTLTNTSLADVLVPSDVLTAVFFSLGGNPSLTRTSAILNSGSSVYYDSDGQPAGGVVGGEWAYKSGLSAPGGATAGISSSGLTSTSNANDGLFGPPDLFPGNDLQSPTSPDGVQYGLLSAGDDTGTGNGGITGSGGLIKNSVIFTLSGLPANFDLASITNVSFQYGTDLTEPNIPGTPGPPGGTTPVPEPATMVLMGIGLIGLAFGIRKQIG